MALTNVTAAAGAIGSIVEVGWDQDGDATVHLEFSVDPGVWSASPDRVLAAGHHEELILGAPYDTDVTWRISAVNAGGTTTTTDAVTHTEAPPEDGLVPETTTVDASRIDPAYPFVFATVSGYESWNVIVDRQGRLVWVLRSPIGRATFYGRLSRAGDALLLDENSLLGFYDQGEASEVVEIAIDGSERRRWATPGLHQPFTELPDHAVAYARQYGDPLAEDVTTVAADGTVSQVFDTTAWLDGLSGRFASSNMLYYDDPTGHFLLTIFTAETTVEIDPVTGSALRWFGDTPGSYAFDPPEDGMFDQHGVIITPDGTLLASTRPDRRDQHVVAREYAIDDANQSLSVVWRYEEDPSFFAGFGDVHRYPDGNTLHNSGFGLVREITADEALVWQIEWPFVQTGRVEPLADLYALAPERP